MRKALILSMALALGLVITSVVGGPSQARAAAQYGQPPDQGYQPYSPDQLDNLLAPIALYPDPLLAQVLIAATYPDQIQDASGWVGRYGANNPGLDDQPWDVSVKAVAHYPAVLSMMNNDLDWTSALGQAYVEQSGDTMASVQHLRTEARAQGNLISTPQQQVIYDRGYIQIVPAEPQYIFVPTYDARVIYSRRVYTGSGFGGYFSFGTGFPIGVWLNHDVDWGSRRVVYDGWDGGGWRARSRPFVHVDNRTYVNTNYRNVTVNRQVVNRQVNFQNVNKFNAVHDNVRFENRGPANANAGARGDNRSTPNFNRPSGRVDANPGGQPNNGRPAAQAPPQVQRQNENRPAQPPPPQAQPQRANDNFRNRQESAQPQARPQQPDARPQQQPQAPPQRANDNFRNRQESAQPQARPQQPEARPQQQPQARPQQQPQARPQVEQRSAAPPARVEQSRPAPPAAQPRPAQQAPSQQQNRERQDRGNNDNKDRRN